MIKFFKTILIVLLLSVKNIKSMDDDKIYNNINVSKLEINNFRPNENIIINDRSINNYDVGLKGGYIDDYDDDIVYNKKVKSHFSKYKFHYIIGGVLLIGTGVGLYFLIKSLTKKSGDEPVIIPTDIPTYKTDIITNTPIHKTDIITNIPTIIQTTTSDIIHTTIPTTIIKHVCEDRYNLCSYKNILYHIKINLINYEEGVDYCFGYMKDDDREKIVFEMNNDTNCILTSKVTSYLFSQVTISDLKVLYNDFTSLDELFANSIIGCLDLTNLNIEKSIYIPQTFKNSIINNFIGIENKNFTNNILSLYYAFAKFGGMPVLNLSSWYLTTSYLTGCFYNIEVEKLDISNFNVKNLLKLDNIFDSEYLKEIHIRNWDTRNVESIDRYFFNYDVLQKVYLNIDNNPRIVSILRDYDFICNNDLCSKKTCIDTSQYCPYNETINILRSKLNYYGIKEYEDFCFGEDKNKTSKIGFVINENNNCILYTNTFSIVLGISFLWGVNLDHLKVIYNNISDLSGLFDHATIGTLDISGLDFDNVTDIGYLFSWCHINNFIGFENKKFNNIISLYSVFSSSSMGNILDLSSWNITTNLMYNCFQNSSFNAIYLDNFKTIDLKSYNYAFDSSNLIYLRIPNFILEASDVDAYINVFNTDKLRDIYFSFDKNPKMLSYFENKGFHCENDVCTYMYSENNTYSYFNNGVNYLFGLCDKIYNITSYFVNDYIVNPFQRLLRMLR